MAKTHSATFYQKIFKQKYKYLIESDSWLKKPNKLKKIIEEATKKATLNYNKLENPKTSDLSTYIHHWIIESIFRKLSESKIQKVTVPKSQKDEDLFVRALGNYLSITSLIENKKLLQEIAIKKTHEEQEKAWEQAKPFKEGLEKAFIELAKQRDCFAFKKGCSNYLEMVLDMNRISRKSFTNFTENVDTVISLINKQLPKIHRLPEGFCAPFDIPCFICETKFPELKIPEQIFNLMEKNYPILKTYKNKISIKYGKETKSVYLKENDDFEITINKEGKKNHQTIGLIHEFGHVATMLYDLNGGKSPLEIGKYKEEKSAAKIELETLSTISPDVYKARSGNILFIFQRVLFELAVYDNPKQSLSQLYANMLSRCFLKPNQKENHAYLLDDALILKPLSSLALAIAYLELIHSQKN